MPPMPATSRGGSTMPPRIRPPPSSSGTPWPTRSTPNDSPVIPEAQYLRNPIRAPVFVQIFTTGGTIDKVYFDARSDYEVGEPQVAEILRNAGVVFDFACESLFRKDSLELTDEDREAIAAHVAATPVDRFI